MKKLLKVGVITALFCLILIGIGIFPNNTSSSFKNVPFGISYPLPEVSLKNPVKKFRVGLQVGHWKADQLPEELKKIRQNNGAEGGGKLEWEVNYAIAGKVAMYLQKHGVEADILPATIPPGYTADAFVAIHADQNPDPKFSGFKTAPALNVAFPSGVKLSRSIESEYQKIIKMPLDREITQAMRHYYGFNFRKFKHSIDPKTPAVIVETGYLSNLKDRDLLINYPEVSAKGIANGILRFLRV